MEIRGYAPIRTVRSVRIGLIDGVCIVMDNDLHNCGDSWIGEGNGTY